MLILNRRRFLQVGSLASAAMMMPKFLKALERGHLAPPGNKVLVIIQLSGGNDGLNTIIPYRNDIYYKARPALGIKREAALSLNDELGIHPALKGLKALYDDGALGILNNVGYPNPDRSHFRSMDIWHSASQSNEYWSDGWIGRYLDAQCKGCDKPTQALEIDDTLSLALKGDSDKGLAMTDPARLYGTSNDKYFAELLKQHTSDNDHHNNADYLYKTMGETISSAAYIQQQFKTYKSSAPYPNTELGRNLRTIANLVMSDINTKVYYVSHGSFDTHVNQQDQQARLFGQLSDALTVFTDDLKANHRFEDVVVMTFSEFGRRVSQNASGGTDHGTANNMFLVGGGLKQPGLINDGPDLLNLKDGDLQYQVDFKSVYATLLSNWLGADDKAVLKNTYSHLSFV
ncbi:Uncharacterized conserved protein, DUF1501 family [Chitinophaga ginsengisegetis]|uniref:Uncharacterized conserved protein, DUF1501 family n=1 Tax=Chitinophaga ginsengisegetis TaxID=393003 RepID=A0A1T5NQQ3_9BACT|nr:DUF1501 domain-containing protein [Chitinophaga ginsengisegetis]MDR6565717.1 uncharacterized protein (DUF1501 family) [Chitinophaga ginsengisegetis]MDR6645446.1 uncharacterized protein (DUF1501 family) [Chitinophaga ginsengisegetis]MDR6651962.1 uncharacterized protein (DUF1501 family) [Chitinophaga ginsengisegetis]SKD02478.1 Uncharacterized conserved protein, DUF1501 family [Chitinophaga ginsengisegetis]